MGHNFRRRGGDYENHYFGVVGHFSDGPTARETHVFTNFLVKIKNRMDFLHAGRANFRENIIFRP
jgi:hypothetical protein